MALGSCGGNGEQPAGRASLLPGNKASILFRNLEGRECKELLVLTSAMVSLPSHSLYIRVPKKMEFVADIHLDIKD